jgi:hypothetical protein
MLELDPAAVKAEFDKRLGKRFFAWQEASVRLDAAAAASTDATPEILQNRNEQFAMPGSYDQAIALEGAGNSDFPNSCSSRPRTSG